MNFQRDRCLVIGNVFFYWTNLNSCKRSNHQNRYSQVWLLFFPPSGTIPQNWKISLPLSNMYSLVLAINNLVSVLILDFFLSFSEFFHPVPLPDSRPMFTQQTSPFIDVFNSILPLPFLNASAENQAALTTCLSEHESPFNLHLLSRIAVF